jgi:hypothetical protein
MRKSSEFDFSRFTNDRQRFARNSTLFVSDIKSTRFIFRDVENMRGYEIVIDARFHLL